MSGFASRWVVLREEHVTSADLDASGTVSDAALARWVGDACVAYLDRCTRLRALADQAELELVHRAAAGSSGAVLGTPTSVVITASAPEFRSSSFTIAVRLRPIGGDDRDVTVNTTSVVRLEQPGTSAAQVLGDEIRDELIALERAAEHML